jgi:hypothetical protein
MGDFFQSLSAIGDTLVNNRTRSERARTLADVGQSFSGGNVDYKALAAKLIAAGDIRNGLMALRFADMRDARLRPLLDAGTDGETDPAEAAGDPARLFRRR